MVYRPVPGLKHQQAQSGGPGWEMRTGPGPTAERRVKTIYCTVPPSACHSS